jgi:hypothetical protein
MAIDIVIQGDYKDRDIKRAQRDLDLLGNQSGAVGSAFSKMSGFASASARRPSFTLSGSGLSALTCASRSS